MEVFVLVNRGKKLEISKSLGSKAATTLAQWIGCFCVVWNCKVAERKEELKVFLGNKKITPLLLPPQVNSAVAHFKTEERPWLKEVPSQIRRNAGSMWISAHNAGVLGLRKPPRFKHKSNKRSCLVTKELFSARIEDQFFYISFRESEKSQPFLDLKLQVPNGMLAVPNQVWISRKGGRFFLSWSYEKEIITESKEVTRKRLLMTPLESQANFVIGVDLGVVNPVSTSTKQVLDFSPQEKQRLKFLDRRVKRYQRKMARQEKGSKNRVKARDRFAKYSYQKQNLRHNFAHHTSKTLVYITPSVLVMEDLKVKNMTARAKAKPVFNQEKKVVRYEKNRAAQKSGLNRAILNVGWGKIRTLTKYKLEEKGKLLELVTPHYSSQECSGCGYTSKENRKDQASFKCLGCGYEGHADFNAPKVLVKRYLLALNTGKLSVKDKPVRKITFRRKPKIPPEPRELTPVSRTQ